MKTYSYNFNSITIGGLEMFSLSLSGLIYFCNQRMYLWLDILQIVMYFLNRYQWKKIEYKKNMKWEMRKQRNILIERNLRLVAHIAKKYSSTNINKDDLISIGTIGLIKGINSYNSGKGVRLATYVAKCIDNEVLMYLRSAKKVNQKYI